MNKNLKMNNKLFSLLFLFMYVTVSFSQNELNAYKYIIVPKTYDFFKYEEVDKYKLNSLTKFLFNKYGYIALFQDEDYPQDLLLNPCLGVLVDIVNDSKLLSTRLKIELKDCSNKIIYTSREGVTREKEFVKAYQEALRNAFISFQVMTYNFDPHIAVAYKINVPSNSISVEAESTSKKEPEPVTEVKEAPSPVAVVVNEPIVEQETKTENTEMSNSKEPVAEMKAAPVPVPVPVETENKAKSDDGKIDNSVLKSYENENISFFIIEQGEELKAYVNETKDDTYKKGELIGTFVRTSIPNVYRVTWQDREGEKKETTGYFDESGNLNIDVNRNGKIEVIIFKVEK